jgi:large subunit ribosomal protein L4
MSVKADIYNQEGVKQEDMNLSDAVFNVDLNMDLIHQAVVTQSGNERSVLAHTKTRSDVRGGGRKPWKQKGTGRARAGTSSSPIWIGGGVTFGPTKDRNFKKKINKKMKQKALLMTLTDKIKNNNLVIFDKIALEEYKTKKMHEILENLENKVLKNKEIKRSVLIITRDTDDKVLRSVNNLPGVKITNSSNINVIDLLRYRDLLFTKDAIEKIEKIYKK